MLSPKEYRDREVLKLVEEAFHQFQISDPNEKRDITNSIKQQLDTSKAVSSYEESDIASSTIYRANLRTALIDIISHLLYAKDLENRLSQIEGVSRNMIDVAMKQLIDFQNKLIKVTGTVRESFVEGLDHGKYTNTIVKEDKLRVNYADIRADINNVSIVTFPAESVFDGVTSVSSENENVLIKTGIGSDLYKVVVTSNSRPSSYVDGSFFSGVVLQATLETESCIPAAISAKAGSSFKIGLWEGYNENTRTWQKLGVDDSYGMYSFIDLSGDTIVTDNMYRRYRATLLFPDYVLNNNLYYYEALVHNIKLFKKDPLTLTESGSFISHVYPSGDFPLYKIKFDANYSGFATFRIRFEGTDQIQYVLPKGEDSVKHAFYNVDTSPKTQHPLPFHVWDENTLVVKDEAGNLLSHTISYDSDDANPTIEINGVQESSVPGYTGYVYVEYQALKPRYIPRYAEYPPEGSWIEGLSNMMNPSVSEAIVIQPVITTDYHDKLDGFVFPLSRVPWRVQEEDTFTFHIGSSEYVTLSATEIFPIGGVVEFNDEEHQYYYYNKKLYTNFDLLAYSNLRVKYSSMATGATVIIDLYGDAKVNDYYIEFIEAEEPIHPYLVDVGTSEEGQGQGDTDGDLV